MCLAGRVSIKHDPEYQRKVSSASTLKGVEGKVIYLRVNETSMSVHLSRFVLSTCVIPIVLEEF